MAEATQRQGILEPLGQERHVLLEEGLARCLRRCPAQRLDRIGFAVFRRALCSSRAAGRMRSRPRSDQSSTSGQSLRGGSIVDLAPRAST